MEHIANLIPAPKQKPSPPQTPSPSQTPACPVCAGKGFLRRALPWHHPDFGKLVPCPHPSHTAERTAKLAKISHLNPDELKIRLTDIRPLEGNAQMLTACQKIIAKPAGWLYIHGGPGNAKSIALMAIVNQINLAGKGPAMYIKLTDLIDWMREAYREKTIRDTDPTQNIGYIDRFNKIKAIPCLAIDELDKARNTPFADDFVFNFLDERYRTGITGQTTTLFASNNPPSTLPDPIFDRIRDGRFSIVENTQPSARPFMEEAHKNG